MVGKRTPLETGDDLTAAGAAGVTVNTNVPPPPPSSGASSPSATGTPTSSSAASINGASLNAPPSVSAVWAYFDKDPMGNSICKFCDRTIKGHHSSNLLSHLRTAGRTDVAHQQASAICEEHRENKRTVKRQKMAMPTAAEFAATYPHLVAAAAAAAMPSFNSPFATAMKKDSPFFPTSSTALAAAAAAATLTRDQQREVQLNAIPTGQTVCSADQLAQDFALMVLTENLPISFATQPGFQNFAQLLLADKKSLLPDEEAVTKNILMLQQRLTLTTNMLLSRARGVSLSVESWTHPSPELSATAKYLSIGVHFSLNFHAYHITLTCIPVGSGVDVTTLKALVAQTVERAGIQDKVIAVVLGDLPWKEGVDTTLGAPDIPSVFSMPTVSGRLPSGAPHPTHIIPCASILLRRCIKKAVVAASFPHHVAAIDDFFRRIAEQHEAYSTLRRKCPALDPVVIVTDDSSSRSYYDVLRDIHESLTTLEQIAQEWQLEFLVGPVIEWIAVITKKLRPFVRYADAFEGEKQKRNSSDKEVHKDGSSSVSTIAAFLVEYVEKQAENSVVDNNDVLAWKAFYVALAKDLRTRFSHLSSPSLAATLLDPRYKNRECCYLEPELERSQAEELLNTWLQPTEDAERTDAATSSAGERTKESHEEDEEDDLLAQLPSTNKDGGQDSAEISPTWVSELTAFLALPLAERNVDPLAWWKTNQLRFPLLAPCAELLLSLPAAAMTGESTMRRVNQTLLRVEGFALDPTIATTPSLIDAFLSFQKNRENVIEWFRSNSTVLTDAALLSDVEAANHFKHIENV